MIDKIITGDLVECIDKANDWPVLGHDDRSGPKYGDVLRVTEVYLSITRALFLRFETWPQYFGFRATCFRKIHSDSEKKATKAWNWTKEPVNGVLS